MSTLARVQSYEEKSLRRYIRSSILPLDRFHRRALNEPNIPRDRLLLLQLLQWFKEEFFTWFDGATCEQCQTTMLLINTVQSSDQEREQGDAHRVELYK